MSEDNPIPQFGPEARRALFHERVLVLDGALDDDNGTLLMTQLLALSAEDPVADIALWIHSPGGSVPSMKPYSCACVAVYQRSCSESSKMRATG